MPLCQTNQKTTIEWQYPGEDKQRILGADDYNLEQVNNLSANGTYKLIYQEAIIRNGHFQGWNNNAYWSGSFIYNGIESYCLYVNVYPFFCIPFDSDSIWIGNPNIPANKPRSRSYGVRIWSQGVAYDRLLAFSSGLKLIDFELQGTQSPKYCRLNITKNGELVYRRRNSVCPTVTYFCGETCPPGTCQCDCGTEVCCYDTATGKAVKSFKK
jgi:hypothetical protein